MSQPCDSVRGRCHRNSQVDGYEYKFAPVQQVDIPGEEWRPMIDPRSGRRVDGRMVSSQGRIKSKAGRISFGCVQKDGLPNKGGVKFSLSNRACASISGSFLFGPTTKSTAFASQSQGWQQEQQCS